MYLRSHTCLMNFQILRTNVFIRINPNTKIVSESKNWLCSRIIQLSRSNLKLEMGIWINMEVKIRIRDCTTYLFETINSHFNSFFIIVNVFLSVNLKIERFLEQLEAIMIKNDEGGRYISFL